MHSATNAPSPYIQTESDLVSMQLAYSTADLEDFVFYGEGSESSSPDVTPPPPAQESGEKEVRVRTLLVVNGVLFELEDEADLPGHPAVTDASAGLLRLVGLDQVGDS